MAGSRVDKLRAFIEARPDDPFPRYALALEYKNAGRLAEAWALFESLLEAHSDYTASYLHAGNTLQALGRLGEAREVWGRGVTACGRKGDLHARAELEAALADAGPA
jgi:tetratricopeptide (TPR) repeat protein